MPEKTIPELIEEALTFDVNVYDHVAEALWGLVDTITRHKAKRAVFCHLYGGSPGVLKEPNSKGPWKLTEEQVQKEFKLTGESFEPCDGHPVMDVSQAVFRPLTSEREIRQAEDRMYRAGVVPYKVEVFNHGPTGALYTVHATSALDARCMAFVLDGGCKTRHWDDGYIELAISYTKVVG